MAFALKLITTNVPSETESADAELSGIDINVPNSAANSKIASYILQAWQAAKSAKDTEGIQTRIEDADRRRKHQYDQQRLKELSAFGGSQVYLGLADYQGRKVTAWLRDLLFGQGEKPWEMESTPIPELPGDFTAPINEALQELTMQFTQATGEPMPPDVQQKLEKELRDNIIAEIQEESKQTAKRMEEKIHDQYVESDYYSALHDVVYDITTYPAGILEGPILVNKPKLEWRQGPDNTWDVKVEKGLHLKWQRTSPRTFYPAPNAKDINDRYLCIITRMTRRKLEEQKSTPGVNNEIIDTILTKHSLGGIKDWLGINAGNEETPLLDYNHPEALFDVLKFWGDLSGQDLIDWGVNAELNAADTYGVCCYMVDQYIFKIVLNYHPLNNKPYHATAFEREPDSIWGKSAMEICAPFDDLCNANARALANNMALASGPQVEINTDRLTTGQEITTLTPWKYWMTKPSASGDSQSQAIRFYQPDDRAATLLNVLQYWAEICDEFLGMPRIMTGVDAPTGAGRTASGFAMYLSNANKFIKQVVLNLDALVISSVNEQYVFNMRYLDDASIKGDLRPKARGAVALSIKEAQQLRRTEFLAALANPIDAQIVPPQGRAYLIRENARSMDMDPDKIVPKDVMAQMAQQPPMQQGAPGAPQQTSPSMPGQPAAPQEGQMLDNGQPVTDFFGE